MMGICWGFMSGGIGWGLYDGDKVVCMGIMGCMAG